MLVKKKKNPKLFGAEVSCPNDEKQRCVKNNQIETKLKTLGNKLKATGHSESPDTLVVRGKQFERLRVRKHGDYYRNNCESCTWEVCNVKKRYLSRAIRTSFQTLVKRKEREKEE